MKTKLMVCLFAVACAIAPTHADDFDDIARDAIATGRSPGSMHLKSLMQAVLAPEKGVVSSAAKYAMAEVLLHVAKEEATGKKAIMKYLIGDKKNEDVKTNGLGAYNLAVGIVLCDPGCPYSLAAFQLSEEARRFAEKECGEKIPSLTEFGYPDKLGDTSRKLSRKKN